MTKSRRKNNAALSMQEAISYTLLIIEMKTSTKRTLAVWRPSLSPINVTLFWLLCDIIVTSSFTGQISSHKHCLDVLVYFCTRAIPCKRYLSMHRSLFHRLKQTLPSACHCHMWNLQYHSISEWRSSAWCVSIWMKSGNCSMLSGALRRTTSTSGWKCAEYERNCPPLSI